MAEVNRPVPVDRSPVDLGRWRARLEAADPGLLGEIAGAAATLAACADEVEAAMRQVDTLSSRFCAAFYRVHPGGPNSLQADADREQVEDALGVMAMWDLADQIRDSHPDYP